MNSEIKPCSECFRIKTCKTRVSGILMGCSLWFAKDREEAIEKEDELRLLRKGNR